MPSPSTQRFYFHTSPPPAPATPHPQHTNSQTIFQSYEALFNTKPLFPLPTFLNDFSLPRALLLPFFLDNNYSLGLSLDGHRGVFKFVRLS